MNNKMRILLMGLIGLAPAMLFSDVGGVVSLPNLINVAPCVENCAAPQVMTQAGVVEGEFANGLSVFKGVPFAAPPIGNLRFHPPVALTPWPGVRATKEFSNVCPQDQDGLNASNIAFGENLKADEDCLYVNIWTPKADNKTRPVMVWIHGGTLLAGSGSSASSIGDILSAKGDVVIVNINYRLGILGGLAHPKLSDPGTGYYANWNVQDMLAALIWVQDNIAAFGGDASNVTVFGESAGSWAATTLMTSPLSNGLFKRVIGQSGTHSLRTVDEAVVHAEDAFVLAGCAEAELSCMRALSVERLLEINAEATRGDTLTHAVHHSVIPVLDGIVFEQGVKSALLAGEASDLGLLIGSNSNEFDFRGLDATFLTRFQSIEQLSDFLIPGRISNGMLKAEVLWRNYEWASWTRWAYPFKTDIYGNIWTDEAFRIPSIRFAEYHSAGGGQSHMYMFAYGSSFIPVFGATHGFELPFVWGQLKMGTLFDYNGVPSAERVRDEVQQSWINFAHTGDPARAGVAWPEYTAGNRQTQVFDINSHMSYQYGEIERVAWDSINHEFFK